MTHCTTCTCESLEVDYPDTTIETCQVNNLDGTISEVPVLLNFEELSKAVHDLITAHNALVKKVNGPAHDYRILGEEYIKENYARGGITDGTVLGFAEYLNQNL